MTGLPSSSRFTDRRAADHACRRRAALGRTVLDGQPQVRPGRPGVGHRGDQEQVGRGEARAARGHPRRSRRPAWRPRPGSKRRPGQHERASSRHDLADHHPLGAREERSELANGAGQQREPGLPRQPRHRLERRWRHQGRAHLATSARCAAGTVSDPASSSWEATREISGPPNIDSAVKTGEPVASYVIVPSASPDRRAREPSLTQPVHEQDAELGDGRAARGRSAPDHPADAPGRWRQ